MCKLSGYTVVFIIYICSTSADIIANHGKNNEGHVLYNLSFHSGTMLPHYQEMARLNRDVISGLEFTCWFGLPYKDRRDNSILGAGYYFSNLGNADVYGNLHAAYMSILTPAFSGELPVQLKLGLGTGYATRKAHSEYNPQNMAIGSHLNAYGQITLTGKIPVFENKWTFRPGISFHHISNGKIIAPNQGMNLLTVNAGLDFRSSHTHRGNMVLDRDTATTNNNRFSIMLAPGTKQTHHQNGKQLFTSSLILEYGYMYQPEKHIGLALGLYYNDTWAHFPHHTTIENNAPSPFQSAIHITLQRDIGPVSFLLHPGIYIYKPAKETPWYTNRLGFKYAFENNITLQFSIKHHWFALADYFEWGIGYEFNR